MLKPWIKIKIISYSMLNITYICGNTVNPLQIPRGKEIHFFLIFKLPIFQKLILQVLQLLNKRRKTDGLW